MERVLVLVLMLASSMSDESNECKHKCLEQRTRLEQLCYKRTEGEERDYCLRGAQSVYEKCVESCNVSSAP